MKLYKKIKDEQSLHSYEIFDKKYIQTGLPMLSMRAGRWVHVENYGTIILYNKKTLKLAGRGWNIIVSGQKLIMNYFTEYDLLVTGKIEQVLFNH